MVKSGMVNHEKIQPQKIEPFKSSEYKMSTEVYFGRGQISNLENLIKESSSSKFLLVAGSHFFKDPKYQVLRDKLGQSGKVEFYDEQIKKSTFEEVDKLTTKVQGGGYDGIIGLGGGAILDSAKVAAVLATNGGIAEDYLINNTSKISQKGIRYIAIPTTSGTGSEVTPWSVLWGEKKYSLSSSEFMFPDFAIVDPSLTDDCPEYVTATSGIDAMVQAIEAYWNVKHNSTSDKYALESVRTIFNSLEKAVKNPDANSRDQMAWGSLIGGLAFSNTATTICHSVSYPMTSHWGISHGQATSITLPMFIEYSFEVLKEREKALLNALGVNNAKEAANKIRVLISSIGLKTRLSELNIPKEGIDAIVKEGFDPDRAGNAPKVPTPEELKDMLLKLY